MKVLEGYLNGKGMKIGIVAARFNEFIVSNLVSGAEDALVRHGVDILHDRFNIRSVVVRGFHSRQSLKGGHT